MHAIGRFGIGFFSVFMLGDVVRVFSRRCDKGRETGRLLEFRGGTSSRPILSPAIDDPVPIDGGTRVEVLLKEDPKGEGGLLHVDHYSKKTIPLAKLIGSVAPNLDVAVEAITEKSIQPVARPGDWLKISDLKLMSRIHPLLDRDQEDLPKGIRNLMQPIVGNDGQTFGRAFISPTRFIWEITGGCITISGLRAAPLGNVDGVLLGEAMTATRELARPLATKEALANWASKQAELIASSVEDEERQARTAEVVLECGGHVGNLKVAKWGSDWLTTEELDNRIRSSTEIAVTFNGEFDYNEDEDDVHPKEFREDFTGSENIIIVFKHDGAILRSSKFKWPQAMTRRPPNGVSYLEDHFRNLIKLAWGHNFEEDEEPRVVGKVMYSNITRTLSIFRKRADGE